MNHNLICGVIYRHPQSDLEAFMVFLNQTLNTISNENKYCLIMGDFNLNLLNCESHLVTDDFINTLGSHFSTSYSTTYTYNKSFSRSNRQYLF
jgi:hypothetical protein